MSIRLRRPAATLPSSSGPLRHPGRHPRRFAFGLAAAAAAAALLLLPHAAAQPLRLGGGVPVPSGGFEEDGSAEVSTGLYLKGSCVVAFRLKTRAFPVS